MIPAGDVTPPPPVRIFVKTVTGKVIPVDISPAATVTDVKKVVTAKEAIPLNHQRLMFAGEMLHDDHTLSSYHIQSQSILHLLQRASSSTSSGSSGQAVTPFSSEPSSKPILRRLPAPDAEDVPLTSIISLQLNQDVIKGLSENRLHGIIEASITTYIITSRASVQL